MTLDEMERAAYRAGDIERARLLAIAADCERNEDSEAIAQGNIYEILQLIDDIDLKKCKKKDLINLIGNIQAEASNNVGY